MNNYNELFIIDLGLCKPISELQNPDNSQVNEIYGVLPYMAPEILRNQPYTPESDIYSFSMIMWEFTSGIPPFKDEAHDYHLILSVCEGKRPEIIENTPKCYVDLMKKCWDSNPSNRPTIEMLENIISEWIRLPNIDDQLKNDMLELVKVNKTLEQKKANTFIIQFHPQACYSSRKLSEIYFQEDSQGYDCMIND
ncbi:kinase-like domain-containing protein [Rhizophagus irregularis DAOM 181602=DAOM 197198]|uniref:Kinase-like domain-containing protein n=1 Tax=Rhizophagus irregularis (strain DAOM 181602 / DAOM 197198 / MUCL 43194) TaxID=747089 RepID=A0A2P4PLL3_RHIID|nr:kinase-like domain-containing protein [Rhizophagus irregularis DAOM 181602=DAOM 197198]POG66284.1 kinase-like domain-containing protein [Rhizophagus irregularis DAOM 181602=DAOM 197198]|eukprot:XP_025173150.1 kinase-like domain-containing protein [Rhizophagus irregularis DAOM 181602=DAOM 197198]